MWSKIKSLFSNTSKNKYEVDDNMENELPEQAGGDDSKYVKNILKFIV